MKLPVLAEKFVVQACIDLLHASGYHVHRLNNGVFQRPGSAGRVSIGEKGQPDLLAIKAYYEPFYLECKTAVGKLSAEQTAWHASAARRGIKVLVIRDVQELRKELASVRKCA